MTDLLPEPAIYAPIQNIEGVYVDKIPLIGEHGLKCMCRQHPTVFKTSSAFSSHCKTQTHIRWLEEINANRVNMAAENAELKETVRTQKEIITRFDIQLRNKDIVICDLLEKLATHTHKVHDNHKVVDNLLD